MKIPEKKKAVDFFKFPGSPFAFVERYILLARMTAEQRTMITLNNISLQRGTKLLFKDVNLSVFAGKRIGIVGLNGSGKSSLFSIFLKGTEPDLGTIYYQSELKIGYLSQEMPESTLTASEYVMEGDSEVTQLLKTLDIAEKENDYNIIADVHSRLHEVDGYVIKAKAAKILKGLGFEDAVQSKKVNEFSGGWRMRLNLARILMFRANLLLLDEPTNHLDLEAIIWLEKWIRTHDGTVMLISHDRDFLDKTIQQIWHIDQQKITLYSGNYTFFEEQYAQKLSQQQAVQKKQQEKIAHTMDFVNRFRAKASKAKQAQSRLKALSKMGEVATIQLHSSIHFEFKECEKIQSSLVNFEDVSFGYGEGNTLFNKVNFAIAPGERIGLLGKNGIGKTTLVKMIVGELDIKSGSITRHNKLKIGYFAQYQLEQLTLDETPLQHLFNLNPKATEPELRKFLGNFGFTKEMAVREIENFSGGEKARLVLAMLVFQKPNLLLLDEPTNHLDLDMRESLALALQTFSGALLVVSHDRYLLRTVVDELWLIRDKTVSPFDGDLEDYESYLLNNYYTKPDKDNIPKNATNTNQNKKDIQNRLKKIEKLLDENHKKRTSIENILSTLNMNDNAEAFSNTLKQFQKIDNEIKSLEEEWLKITESLI